MRTAPAGRDRHLTPATAPQVVSSAGIRAASFDRPRVDQRSVFAAAMAVLAGVGVVASGYLSWVKVAGGTYVCFVVSGCDTVQQSSYSSVFGVPLAFIGLAMALVVLGFVVAWWRTGDRRLLYVPYGTGLLSLFVIAYLNYLELFVIRAICAWCETFAASVVLGWIVTVVALSRTPAPAR